MRAATPRAGEARLGRAPAYLLLPAALAVAFLVVPLVTLVLRAPVRGLPERLTDPVVLDDVARQGLRLGTVVAFMATAATNYGAHALYRQLTVDNIQRVVTEAEVGSRWNVPSWITDCRPERSYTASNTAEGGTTTRPRLRSNCLLVGRVVAACSFVSARTS